MPPLADEASDGVSVKTTPVATAIGIWATGVRNGGTIAGIHGPAKTPPRRHCASDGLVERRLSH